MKRAIMLAGVLMLMGAAASALGQMDANERRVRIIEGPRIFDVSDHSAKIEWVTNFDGANHVTYRRAGSNEEWQSAYHRGGGTHHFLVLDNLEPGRTYEWQILTRDGDVRKQGEFRTEGHRHGRDHDHDYNGGGYGGDRVAIYRSVDPSSGSHFYSTDPQQILPRYRTEGPAGFILGREREGTRPLYFVYGAKGDSLLTVDENEVRGYVRSGYRSNGVIGYIATTQWPGTQPLFRLVKPDGSGHLFTTSIQEREQTLRRGWKEEGPVGYVWLQ